MTKTMIFGVQSYHHWEVTQICYVYKLIVQLKRRREGCSSENKTNSFIAPERSRQHTLYFKLNKLLLDPFSNAVKQRWPVDRKYVSTDISQIIITKKCYSAFSVILH